MIDKNIKNAEQLIKSVGIPPQPTVIMEIRKELGAPNPNTAKIARLVSEDVGLSAVVVKIASSPFIGMGKVSSIDRALHLMGMNNFYNLVVASALLESLNIKGVSKKIFDTFWNHSLQIAKTASIVMKKAEASLQGDAYMAGLFHDCAVPLLIKKFTDYIDIVDFAIGSTSTANKVEDSLYKTTHSVVGYILAKSWHLPVSVYEAILWHHSSDMQEIGNESSRKITTCIKFSEKLILEETVKYYKGVMQPFEFDTITSINYTTKHPLNKLQAELHLDKDDVSDIRDEIQAIVETKEL